MENSPTLFAAVQQRLAQARTRVETLDISEDAKAAIGKRLSRLDRASRQDLSVASREVKAVHADLDAGVIPIYDN